MARQPAHHRPQRRIMLLVGAEVLFALLTWLLAMVGLTSDRPTSPLMIGLVVLALLLASGSLVAAFRLACRADPRLVSRREPWETSLREVILAAHATEAERARVLARQADADDEQELEQEQGLGPDRLIAR